jgi:hypothetical protein
MEQCKKCSIQVEKLAPRSNKCQSCQNEYLRGWKLKNKDKVKNHSKTSYEKDKIAHQLRMKQWRKNNPNYMSDYGKSYFQENKEQIFQYYQNRRKNNTEFRVTQNLRTRIWNAINEYDYSKTDRTLDHLGCSISEFLLYLEQRFTPEMTWDNYGTYWEIDHIIPLSKGGSFHYTNTQPLTISENRTKKANIY